jgi:predicted RecA/RadA family phage recombinase
MPYERPSGSLAVRIPAAANAIVHGQCVLEAGLVGVAVKTATPPANVVVNRDAIAVGEAYNLRPHGVHRLPTTSIGAVARGQLVYITAANALSLTSAGNTVVGRCVHLAGEHGVQTGFCEVDFDLKV